MSVNKVILVGNVGKDPDIRFLDKGVSVAEFTLATTERGYTMQNGTQIPDRTEWHNIKAWRGLSELAEKYIRKGSQLYIEGKIQTRSWEKDGIKRYATDIVADTIQLLGKRPDGVEPLAPTAVPQQQYAVTPPSVPTYSTPVAPPPVSEPEEKDDLPF